MTQTVNTGFTTTDTAVSKVRTFLDYVFPEPRRFAIRLWDGTLIRSANPPIFTVVLNDPGALRRMFTPPLELSLGEAFVRKDFEIEGDLIAAISVLSTFNAISSSVGESLTLLRLAQALPASTTTERHIRRGPAQLSGAVHSKERDKAAIQYHYDVGNDFYALWLDKRMIYSCAYFVSGTENIDTAQEQKLEHICRKLHLKPGDTLLDIGCGWGGLVLYAAQKYGVQATGITLSKEQHALATQRIADAGLSDRVTVKIQDYRDIPNNAYDKIVSVGMFEHVGRARLPEYFDHAYRALKAGGLFLNHGIAANVKVFGLDQKAPWRRLGERLIVGGGSFGRRYIFPDGDLVPVSEVNLMAETTGFEVRDVENLREHYALTLRHWVARLEAHRDDVIRLTNETVYRTWKLYMSASVYGFDNGNINVNQSLLAKPINGHVDLPLSRADLYVDASQVELNNAAR